MLNKTMTDGQAHTQGGFGGSNLVQTVVFSTVYTHKLKFLGYSNFRSF